MGTIAVDIGNTRIKLGRFANDAASLPLPQPDACVQLDTAGWRDDELAPLLEAANANTFRWLIASVNRPGTEQMCDQLARLGVEEASIRILANRELPIEIKLPFPGRVGSDRLLAGVAVNRLRHDGESAISIDVGSAITIDVVDDRGAFVGGAILPGVALSASALNGATDQLPLHHFQDLLETPPPALGNDTEAAIASGLYWGAIGAIREIVYRLQADMPRQPRVVLTGGAAPVVAELLAQPPFAIEVAHKPHLVLSGIVLSGLPVS